jgi:peptidoglycan hydrolase-like amidase
MTLLVAISVFSLFHPHELVVRTPERTVHVTDAFSLPADSDFTLAVPGKIERHFRGGLEISEERGELRAIVRMDLETAVASIVAAEISTSGAPIEALRAQAVAARSFLTAARGRHRGFDFCDTTHCQFLRQPPDLSDKAFQATESTRGLTLRFREQTVAALYSADCGGHTDASPPGGDGYAYSRVMCVRKGARRGHGMGLCQVGAAALAAQGKSYLEILAFYYPGASVR